MSACCFWPRKKYQHQVDGHAQEANGRVPATTTSCTSSNSSSTSAGAGVNGLQVISNALKYVKRVWCNVHIKHFINRDKSCEQTEDSLIRMESGTVDCEAIEPNEANCVSGGSGYCTMGTADNDGCCPHNDVVSYAVPQEATPEDLSLPQGVTSEHVFLLQEDAPRKIATLQKSTLEDITNPQKSSSENITTPQKSSLGNTSVPHEATSRDTDVNNLSGDSVMVTAAKVIHFDESYPKLSLAECHHDLTSSIASTFSSEMDRENNESGDDFSPSSSLTSQQTCTSTSSADSAYSSDSTPNTNDNIQLAQVGASIQTPEVQSCCYDQMLDLSLKSNKTGKNQEILPKCNKTLTTVQHLKNLLQPKKGKLQKRNSNETVQHNNKKNNEQCTNRTVLFENAFESGIPLLRRSDPPGRMIYKYCKKK